MYYKKPTCANGINLSLIFSLLGFLTAFGQSRTNMESIRAVYDQHRIASFVSKMEAEHISKQSKIDQILKTKGWTKSEKSKDGSVVELKDIGTDGTPLFYTTLNDFSNQVSRANALYKNGLLDLGLNGSGLQVGVWDAGAALTTHQEFDTRAKNSDNSKKVSLHATLVTGNLISAGIRPNAKGVAYKAQALTYDWSRDKIEVAQAAANGLLLSNHSYGIKSDRVPDWYFGSYIKVSQDWDKIMYNAPYYLMVNAAGNAQRAYDNESPSFGKTADGFDVLLGFATSKNGLTVAGANTKIGNKGELKEARVASYSSLGPVDDGRIKPDLAGDGSSIFSTSSTTDTSYDTSVGTSMAAPGVTGSLLLLQQYHEELYGNYMKAATLKGLALHTADDVDAKGPDYKMGWGIINVKAAAVTLQNKGFNTLIKEETLTEGDTFSITVNANGNETLMASISWTDPEGEYINKGDLNNRTAALTNDLDIKITKNGSTYFPWKLDPTKVNSPAVRGTNSVDPFERVEVDNAKGEYTITVTHKGGLKNGLQDFSLIVSGAQVSKCNIDVPSVVTLLSSSEDTSRISWSDAEETLFEIQYKTSDEDTWKSELIWRNDYELTALEVGTTYEVRVRAICTENMVSDFSEEIRFEFNGTETELSLYRPLGYNGEVTVKIFPNPAVEWISIGAQLSEDAVYSIITTSGNIVKKAGVTERINVSDLATGLYVLVVEDHSGMKSSKFYKN